MRVAYTARAIFHAQVIAICAAMACGCGGRGGPQRVAVGGTVSKGGAPLPKGMIMFRATAGELPPATAEIQAGRYQFTDTNGPTPGRHEVMIQTTFDGSQLKQETMQKPPPSGRPPTTSDGSSGLAPTPWTFEADIPAESKHERNFELP